MREDDDDDEALAHPCSFYFLYELLTFLSLLTLLTCLNLFSLLTYLTPLTAAWEYLCSAPSIMETKAGRPPVMHHTCGRYKYSGGPTKLHLRFQAGRNWYEAESCPHRGRGRSQVDIDHAPLKGCGDSVCLWNCWKSSVNPSVCARVCVCVCMIEQWDFQVSGCVLRTDLASVSI